MVNRRLLRTKAFQTIYAFRTLERANYQLVSDYIAGQFLPNLDLMIPKEEQMHKLEGLRKLAEVHFEELFKREITTTDIPADAQNVAKKALEIYRDAVKRDRTRITHQMLEDITGIYTDYLKLLQLLLDLADVAVWDEQRRLLESEHKTSRLGQNQVLLALRKLPNFETEVIRNNAKWGDEDQNMMRKLFLEAILPDPTFQAYLRTTKHSFDEDLAIVLHILKTFILKHHTVVEYFEEKDLNWGEKKDVLKSLATKTFKINTLEELELQPLAMNWEDDKFFFTDLFNYTLDNDLKYEKWIIEQTKNWEADRLAMTDMIILKMGLAEMIHFPSIPVKVSINEYIELGKNYSTPKSGQFINGLLDVLSHKLQQENVIRKSGRGLIDNK